MARLCTVCAHPQRWDIDVELARHAESYRGIAGKYGLYRTALQRHERNHMSMSWRQSKELLAMLSAKNLLAKLGAIRESRGNIEAYARIDPVSGPERRVATHWDEREQERQQHVRDMRSAFGLPPDID